MGNTAPCGAAFVTRLRALVCETDADLQRCARLGSARTVDLADFRVLAGSPKHLESPDRPARPPHGRCLQASLNCKAELRNHGFAEAATVHSALFRLKNGRGEAWNRGTPLVVDEAAMLDSRVMGELLAEAKASGAKLVL